MSLPIDEQPRDSSRRKHSAAAPPNQPPSQPHGLQRLRRRRRPRSTEAARAREGFERRLASPRLVGRSAPVARGAGALAVRAPAAIASAAAAERGDEEREAILRAVVGRGSAPTGSACSFSSRGARLHAETARGTRVWWSWVALEPGVTRGSAHQRAARTCHPGGRAEPWGRGGPCGGSAAAETELSLYHLQWITPQMRHPERPILKTAPPPHSDPASAVLAELHWTLRGTPAPFAVIVFTPAAHTEADRVVEPLRGGIGLVDLQDTCCVAPCMDA
jgi:hypothetical protein